MSEVSLLGAMVLELMSGGWVGGFSRLELLLDGLVGQRVRWECVADGSSGSLGLSFSSQLEYLLLWFEPLCPECFERAAVLLHWSKHMLLNKRLL